MIIVEGMDGTGKSSLIERITSRFSIPVHERASSSRGGPVADLFEWANRDVNAWGDMPVHLYDRHPLISEYIYGPVTRGTVDPMFYSADAIHLTRRMQADCMVIFCDPEWTEVHANLAADPHNQMAGVMDNSRRLHLLYKSFRHHWAGQKLTWDYRQADVMMPILINNVSRYVTYRKEMQGV